MWNLSKFSKSLHLQQDLRAKFPVCLQRSFQYLQRSFQYCRELHVSILFIITALLVFSCDSTNKNPTYKDDVDGLIEMAQIPAGAFSMGTESNGFNNERPVRKVTLSAFKIGKYEVTQEQYQAVMGTNPSYFYSHPAEGEIQNKRPVENVTWYAAVEFCNRLSELEGLTSYYNIDKTNKDPNNINEYDTIKWLVTINESANGYRLPTEAQWEYACRAGSTTDWYFGDTENEIGNFAWYAANSNHMTHEVRKKQPNAFGLYDMHGNVWEWCWDWYGDYHASNQIDYTGPVSGADRTLRGGSWDISPVRARSAYRYGSYASFKNNVTGFRVVRP